MEMNATATDMNNGQHIETKYESRRRLYPEKER